MRTICEEVGPFMEGSLFGIIMGKRWQILNFVSMSFDPYGYFHRFLKSVH